MLKKLRIRFVCINMLIVSVMLLVILGLLYSSTRRNLEAQSLSMMQQIALNPSDPESPGEQQQEIQLPYFALQIGRNGRLIATNGGYYDLSDTALLQQFLDIALNSEQASGVVRDYNLRFYRTMSNSSLCIVFADISSEQQTLNGLIRTCLLVGGISFAIFFLISLFFARWAIRPVEQAWTQQHQFVADASHELKTPLTVILTNAELLRENTLDAPMRDQCADSILTMSHQMRSLVERLLELARVDNGAVVQAMERFDLSQTVADAILPFEPVFFEHRLEIHTEIQDGIQIKGSPAHLKQVVEILLDNAVKYSAAPSTVHVRLSRSGSRCLLAVLNYGTPISHADLQNIFKRFYRADQVRTMSHSYGLGLPIAQSIVHEHRGKIWAQSDGGWNTFSVELPTA